MQATKKKVIIIRIMQTEPSPLDWDPRLPKIASYFENNRRVPENSN